MSNPRIDRAISKACDFCINRGIDPFLMVLPFMIIVFFLSLAVLKGLFWALTYGL